MQSERYKKANKKIPILCDHSRIAAFFHRLGILSGKSRKFTTMRLTGDMLHVAYFQDLTKTPTRLQKSIAQSLQLCNQAILNKLILLVPPSQDLVSPFTVVRFARILSPKKC